MRKFEYIFYRSIPIVFVVLLGGVVVLKSQVRSVAMVEPVGQQRVTARFSGLNSQRHQFAKITNAALLIPVVTTTVNQALVSEMPDPVAIHVTLIIQSPKQKSRWSFQVVENSSVDAMMRWASERYHFSYNTKPFSGLGVFVDELAGIKSDSKSGMYWLYQVNGVMAAQGVSSMMLHDGDTITWKYVN